MNSTYQPRVTPWEIEEGDFHKLPSFEEKIRFLIHYAVLAPSGHNTQPWRFKLVPDGMLVYADSSRCLAVADPDNRELTISVGASLMNLRVAAAHFGLGCEVKYLTDPSSSLRASVKISPSKFGYDERAEIFPAITKRHTNRRSYDNRELNEAAVWKLSKYSIAEKASLRVLLSREMQGRIARLIAQGDRTQLSDPAYRTELASWIRSNFAHEGDGISADGIGIPDFISRSGPWLVKTLNAGRFRGRADAQLAAGAAALVLLHGEDTLESLLEAGELLERFLLTLTMMRLQYSFFNQPIEIRELRGKLREMLGLNDMPQLLFRIGYGKPVTRRMPRRPLESVLVP